MKSWKSLKIHQNRWYLGFEWLFKMFERDQSRGTQVRMQNIGLVCRNASRRSRNVHRDVQKPPTRVERFQTKPKNRWFRRRMPLSWILMDLGRFWLTIGFDPFLIIFWSVWGDATEDVNIGLIYKNSSRRCRSVHRVAQNTPRTFPDQI